MLVSAPTETIFSPFLLASTGDGCATPALSACAAGNGQTTFPAAILAQRDITRFLVSRIPRGSVRFFLAEFLEARIISERIEHGIESEQRGSERARRESALVRDRE